MKTPIASYCTILHIFCCFAMGLQVAYSIGNMRHYDKNSDIHVCIYVIVGGGKCSELKVACVCISATHGFMFVVHPSADRTIV